MLKNICGRGDLGFWRILLAVTRILADRPHGPLLRSRAEPLLMIKPSAKILPMKMQDFQGATINLQAKDCSA